MSCVHWWWVCRALDVHTGYMWTLSSMYTIGEEEKKKNVQRLISMHVRRYAFTSRMFSVHVHAGASYMKYSFSWWMYRSTQQDGNTRGAAKGRKKKNVIAFVFRWKSTPHFISMNIFLFFFITYFLFNLFLLPSLHLVHVGIYDDYIFRAFDARENNRNWTICTRFCNKSYFFPKKCAEYFQWFAVRHSSGRWSMMENGKRRRRWSKRPLTFLFVIKIWMGIRYSYTLQLCAPSISLHKNKNYIICWFWLNSGEKIETRKKQTYDFDCRLL